MQTGFVVGRATSTVKHPTMQGQKLMIVQAHMADGRSVDADPVIAVDCVGAGIGERVLFSSDGKYTREFLKADATPVRWAIIGICDS
jgi:ethanolamine utilization protein EutN